MQLVSVASKVCVVSRSDTLWHYPTPPSHTLTYAHMAHFNPHFFTLQHIHTLLIHPLDSDSMFHVATLSCHISFLSATLSPSLPLLYSLCLPILCLAPLPSLHPINSCWHFLPQLRKKQLKAIDPRRTHLRMDALEHAQTSMRFCTRHTHLQTHAWPWICKWVFLTFKDRGKPGDFILHGTVTGYVCRPF